MSRRRGFGTIIQRRYRQVKGGPILCKPGYFARIVRDGKTIQRGPFRTEGEADAYLARTYAAILKAEATGVRPLPRVTFCAFWPTFQQRVARKRKDSTRKMDQMRWKGVFEPYWGSRPLCEVRREDIEDWLALRERGAAPGPAGKPLRPVKKSSLNRDIAFLSVLFRYATDAGLTRANPCEGIGRSREKDHPVPFISHEDVARIIAHAEPDIAPVVRFLADTGMRRGEVEALLWTDVDSNRQVVVVRDSKNSTSREIPWTRAVEASLFDQRLNSDPGRGHVFPILQELTRKQITIRFNRAVKAADLPHLRIHDLRHHFGSSLVRAGVPLPDVQKLMGHKTLTTTMRYACHAPEDAGSRAIATLDQSRPRGEKVVHGVVHSESRPAQTD